MVSPGYVTAITLKLDYIKGVSRVFHCAENRDWNLHGTNMAISM